MFPLLVLWPFAHIRWHSSGPYDWPKSAVCLYLEKPASTKLRIDNSVGGIVHALKSGCRWCDCPAEYGPATTIHNRFVRWARRGVWENLFRELARSGRSTETQMIDEQLHAHQSTPLGSRWKGGSTSTICTIRYRSQS